MTQIYKIMAVWLPSVKQHVNHDQSRVTWVLELYKEASFGMVLICGPTDLDKGMR